MKKKSNWHRKWQNPQNSILQSFSAVSVNFFKDFVNWKILKGQQGKYWLSSKLLWGDNCNVLNENVSNWHRKCQNFQIFEDFMHFLLSFCQNSWTGIISSVNKEKVGCPVVVCEKILAMFWMKMSQMSPKMTKLPKFSNFQRFYTIFSKFSTDFVNWNVERVNLERMCCPVCLKKR